MADEPVEKLFVSIEADIAALLLQTANAVDKVEKRLVTMEKKGKRSFDETGRSAKKMGVVIGFVAGQVQTLNRMLINMARQVPRAFKAVIRATLEANKLFEKFSTQFTTLLGGTEAAQKRVQELVEFNIKTPFELPEIVEASRVLQIFGGDLLATGDNLRMVGDIAAGVNRPIADVALWIGRAYDALQNGRPFGITALALQRMGALSGDARAELERLQEEGVNGEEAWSRFTELVGTRFAGNMERLAGTLVGIQSNLADFRTELLRISGEALFENIKEDAQRLLDILEENRKPLSELGISFGKIAANMERMATSGILEQLERLEPAHVEELANAMSRFADALERTSDKKQRGDVNGLIEALTSLIDVTTSLINLLEKIKQPFADLKTTLEESGVAGSAIVNSVEALELVFKSITNPLGAMIGLVNEGTEAWRNLNEQLEKALGFSLVDLTEDLAEATAPENLIPDLSAFSRGGEFVPPIIPILDDAEESSIDLLELLQDLATDLLNEQDDTDRALEELSEDHAERMTDIAEKGADKRLDIEEDYGRDLAKLAKKTAEQRAEIFEDTQRDLEELARDTDDRLADERQDFQTEERRDTEDHLREMRRLTQQYLLDLEDAVKERDARAVVDLQRRFALEQQRREEDFGVNQGRERQDFDQRLAEIRDDEARRREEILRSQAEELADLMQHEQERRAEIEASRQEQLTKLDEQLAEARQREAENYAERQADLQNALAERLQAIAKELADEDDINEQGARAILSTLANYFGRGGEIDKLMADFQRRAQQRMSIEVRFDTATQRPQESLGSTLPPIPRFQHGGSMVARPPGALALFGESGPELAQFTPLNQGGGQAPQKLQIEFTGSAPPGIRSPERDQIAEVLMDALRDTGQLG